MNSDSTEGRDANDKSPREPTAEATGEALAEGDRVMHPAHGIGRIVRIAVEEVSGFQLEFVHVVFEESRLTLRVPSAKVRAVGLRRIASHALIEEALAVLKGRPKASRAMWARRAQEYQAKINSGDPRLVAEVIRDLRRNAASGEQSYSERQIYEAALDRLASEIAAVEGVRKEEAITRLGGHAVLVA